MNRTLAPCGTWGAYKRHRRHGEDACDACRAACRTRAVQWRAGTLEPSPRDLMPCGTLSAYQRHLRRGEKTCDECRAANRDHSRWVRGSTANPDAREAALRITGHARDFADAALLLDMCGLLPPRRAAALRKLVTP